MYQTPKSNFDDMNSFENASVSKARAPDCPSAGFMETREAEPTATDTNEEAESADGSSWIWLR